MMNDERRYWDGEAASYDDEPDHGLGPTAVLAAWTELLEKWLPRNSADVLDIGCGTGSLSVVMAGLGHRVTGIDFSPAMIERAEFKAAAAGLAVNFQVMDAAGPQFPPNSFDVLLCRHVLWALPETAEVLERWSRLVRENGRLILIEGFWETGSGLHADEVVAAMPGSMWLLAVENLSDRADYWGRTVSDERFIVVAEKD